MNYRQDRSIFLHTVLGVPLMLLVAGLATLQAQEVDRCGAVVSVERIWDRAGHNAFTDLIEWEGRLYCCFREGSGHVPGLNGTVRIIATGDGANWESVALLEEKDVDLRDPKLSVTPDGRLMVVMGGSYYKGRQLLKREGRVSFCCRDEGTFSRPVPVVIDAAIRTGTDWLWRVTWHEGKGYGVVYQPVSAKWGIHLVVTGDGIAYTRVAAFDLPGKPNETTLRFLPDGSMVALVRREGEDRRGFLGKSLPPYKDWSWIPIDRRLGGPNFVVLPGGRLLGGTRSHGSDGKTFTSLVRLGTDGQCSEVLVLPSGGDTSYPGLVIRDDRLLVSYYSSHEGKTAIYLATLRLEPFLAK